MSEPTHWSVGLNASDELPITIQADTTRLSLTLVHAKAMRDALILMVAAVEENEQKGGQHD